VNNGCHIIGPPPYWWGKRMQLLFRNNETGDGLPLSLFWQHWPFSFGVVKEAQELNVHSCPLKQGNLRKKIFNKKLFGIVYLRVTDYDKLLCVP